MFSILKKYVLTSLLFMLCWQASALAQTPATTEEIPLQVAHSAVVTIDRLSLTPKPEGMLLRGIVRSRFMGHGAIPGWLRVELIDKKGNPYLETNIDFVRHSIKSRNASFHLMIENQYLNISQIRISHQMSKKSDTESDGTIWTKVN